MSGGRPAVGKTRPIVEEAMRVGGGRGLPAQSHVEVGQRRPPAAAPGRRARRNWRIGLHPIGETAKQRTVG